MRIFHPAVLPALFLLLSPPSSAVSQGRLFDTWLGYDVGTWTTGRYPVSVAVGDIDGDGDPDFVASKSDFAAYNFAAVKNNGDGTYGRHVLVSAIAASGDIALADVDGDGDLDVALVDAGRAGAAGSTLSVFRNDGQGAFGQRQTFAAGGSPTSLATADFDHDGDVDVAVTNRGFFAEGTTVNLLKNDGAGSFANRVTFSAGLAPNKVRAVDLNADGWADLAVANDPSGSVRNRVTVLMNDTIGGFSPAVAYDASIPQGYANDGGACLAAGDMDNDGDIDLIYSSRKIYVDGILPIGGYQLFSNNGDGTYGPKQYKSFGVSYSQGVEDLEVADLDGDGWKDIVGAQFSDTAESAYYVVLRGAGNYPPAHSYPSGQGVYSLALEDANGDGAVDVFVGSYYSYAVMVHENLGAGTFRAAPRFETVPLHRWIDAGDVDGDGDLDIATAGGYGTEGSVAVLRNNGQAAFSAPTEFDEQYSPGGIKLRDLDGGGSLDLVWGDFNAPNGVPLHVHYRLNDGAGNFGPSVTVPMSMADINDVNAVDLDHDGDLDIVASDSLRDEIKIATNLGGGAFSSPAIYAGPSGPTQMVFGDFNADGDVDLAVTGPEPYGYSHEVGVLLGNGNASFQAAAIYLVDDGPYAIAAGDFDGDGHLDIATANRGFENDRQPSLSVLRGNGNGTFQPEVRYVNSSIGLPTQVVAVDADGDGDTDLLASNYSSHDLSFFANRGDGTFEPHVRYGVDTELTDFRYADFDGDGRADIAGLCSPPLPIIRSVISVVRGSVATGPLATTQAATGIRQDRATLNATVNPGGHMTSAHFQYGTTTAYGRTTRAISAGAGNTPVAVAIDVKLACATVYHFRVVASNAMGTSTGDDETFTTPRCSAPGPAPGAAASERRFD